MHPNQQLITSFYSSFQNKDYTTMQNSYADNAVFSDAVFVNLNAKQAKAMWEMLCSSGTDVKIEFANVQADENTGSAEWTATYIFSRTGRKVVNHIKAHFIFSEGKIIKHADTFSFYKWAGQAFGQNGILLGWTPFFRNKVRKTALQNLAAFMNKK